MRFARAVASTIVMAGATAIAPALACDVCAVYTATEVQETKTGFRASIAEQFSRFTTLQEDGEEIPNPNGERLESSITQLVVGYQLLPELGVQLNLPIITRHYRRLEAAGVASGDETGIGDLSLLASVLAFRSVSESTVTRLSVLGGVKFPTGDADRLAEELGHGGGEDTDHDHGGDDPRDLPGFSFGPQHDVGDGDHDAVSGVHGHDLALGTGSTDLLFGGQTFASWEYLFVTGIVQYTIRTKGEFGYRYANELTWNGGPGAFVLLAHDHSLGVQALLTGESKGADTLNGDRLDDTSLTALYVGPGFHFSWGTSLSADLAADLPVIQNNSDVQIVHDFRLRAGVTWRF
jgi:hypothetical protein